MLRFLKGVFGVVVALTIVFVGVLAFDANSDWFSLPTSIPNPFADLASSASTSATNAALEASGIKDTVEDELRDHAGVIAERTGMSEDRVNGVIDDLDIQNWEATELPSDAVETGTQNVSYQGTDAVVTTYEDPSYVTVEVYGQEMTLAVPESAQGYMGYLGYLG